MKISDYNYDLLEERIALRPPLERGASRLLVLDKNNGNIQHDLYKNLDQFISAGDLVILNNTRVIRARLDTMNEQQKPRELLLLEEHAGSSPFERLCLHKGKLRAGETLTVSDAKIHVTEILDSGIVRVKSDQNLLKLAEAHGHVPLPPYMHRDADAADTERYQTVFADAAGSVAAPTASLNFTHDLEQRILAKGAHIAYLTLHVGLGTFLPIRTDNIEDHVMHSEYFIIPPETIELIRKTKQNSSKIVAVGTTVARTLEFAANQILSNKSNKNLTGEANIFIYPGYKFKLVDALLTNFHAPKSTVLMLTAAFAGWPHLQSAYQQAVLEKYAFLSYGDSMFIY